MDSSKSGGAGGCICGAVRYRYVGQPSAVGLCQCERCQRQSGSAFLIGGTPTMGAQPTEVFVDMVDEALAEES